MSRPTDADIARLKLLRSLTTSSELKELITTLLSMFAVKDEPFGFQNPGAGDAA